MITDLSISGQIEVSIANLAPIAALIGDQNSCPNMILDALKRPSANRITTNMAQDFAFDRVRASDREYYEVAEHLHDYDWTMEEEIEWLLSDVHDYFDASGRTVAEVRKRIFRPVYSLDAFDAEQYGLVLIEDIELGLHPYTQRKLVDLMSAWTERSGYPRQIIFTTNSNYLLNSLEPQQVLIVQRHINTFSVREFPLDLAEIYRHKRGWNLGALWTTNAAGGC